MRALASDMILVSEPSTPAVAARTPFELYRDRLIHDWLRTLTTLGYALIPVFFALDYFTMPAALLPRFAAYRAGATAAVLLQFVLLRQTRPTRFSYIHGYAFSLLVAGMIVWMTIDLGGFDSSYYAGLLLVIFAVNLLLPWRPIHSTINGLLIVGMYLIGNLAWGGPFHPQILVNNLYFLVSSVIISVAINHAKHRLIEQEFNLRAELVQANQNLDRSRLELKAARDALWGEMEVAKRIQTALLPPDKKLGKFAVSATMHPAAEVGGDYYDILETRSGERWVTIGDVSGHGVESGLVMMMTQTSILTLVDTTPHQSPAAVFHAVNDALRDNISRLGTGRYMTLNVVRVHDDHLVLAGKHQDVLVYRRKSGEVESISNEGCWIGMVPDTRGFVNDQRIEVGDGDAVLFFTDGVTEAMAASGEMYGQERLAAVLAKTASLAPDQAVRAIVEDVRRFQSEQADDITVLLLKRQAA